jgi:hypothetical protein
MLRSLAPRGALLLAIFSLGCAELSYGERKLIDETVLSTRHQIKPSASVRASLKQSGTEIRLTATNMCDLVEVKEVRRTFGQERENDALVPELVLLSLGAVPAGLGVAFLVDAPNVYDNDRNERQYNASGRTGAIASGLVLLAWGVGMMSVPLVDFARSATSKEDEETRTEEGSVIRRDMPCEAGVAPAQYRAVSGRVPGDFFSLGQTDASGLFSADLVAVVPSRIFESTRPPASMEVVIEGTPAGSVSLAGVEEIQRKDRRENDAKAWSQVDVIACRSASPDHPSCNAVRAYMQRFPNGEHREEARKLLDPSTRSQSVQVAASPEDIAKAEAARKKAAADAEAAKKAQAAAGEAARKAAADAEKAAAEACRKKCEASCKKEATCTQLCVEDACE